VFGPGFGKDRVEAFDADPSRGQDLLDISGLGVTAARFASAVSIAQAGADAVVTIGGDTITLVGANASSLGQSDFILA
jgi:hypothetical protein